MGSMGFFLCDWSVEFLRYRAQKKKAKKQRQNRKVSEHKRAVNPNRNL